MSDETEMFEIKLSDKEALVLFEAIHKINDSADIKHLDEAEMQTLYNLEAALERELSGLFSVDYKNILAEAKKYLMSI